MASNLWSSIGVTMFLVSCAIHIFLSSTRDDVGATVPAVYVFGDSLADVGNNNHLYLSYLKANYPYNGIDYPGGKATGRFSNGKNSADFLAEKLGVPSSPPYLSMGADSNRTEALLAGINFASAGGGILDSTNKNLCLPMNQQIQYYSIVHSNLMQQLGSSQAGYHLSKSIFAFMIGSNDILNSKLPGDQLVDSMITSLRTQLKNLYNLGARKFAFAGTGSLGCCPIQRDKMTGTCNAERNIISFQFDTALAALLQQMKSELSDMNYSFFNSTLLVSEYMQNPATYGFTEVKAACCGLGSLSAKMGCLPVSSLCPNRSNHLFWDFYHPSERTSEMLVATFLEGSLPHVYPINLKQLSIL